MKTSEVIEKYTDKIQAEMPVLYRSVLESYGRIQYRLYVWEDGEIEVLEDAQGSNTFLKAKEYEPRSLFYVGTISEPFFNPWDCSDHAAPDNEDEFEEERKEIIDSIVDEYKENLPEVIDMIIKENKEYEACEW